MKGDDMLKWKRYVDNYTDKEVGRLGRIAMFSVWWNGLVPRTEPKKYQLSCRFPGYKETIGLFLTAEEAKEEAERVLKEWLDLAGLQIKE